MSSMPDWVKPFAYMIGAGQVGKSIGGLLDEYRQYRDDSRLQADREKLGQDLNAYMQTGAVPKDFTGYNDPLTGVKGYTEIAKLRDEAQKKEALPILQQFSTDYAKLRPEGNTQDYTRPELQQFLKEEWAGYPRTNNQNVLSGIPGIVQAEQNQPDLTQMISGSATPQTLARLSLSQPGHLAAFRGIGEDYRKAQDTTAKTINMAGYNTDLPGVIYDSEGNLQPPSFAEKGIHGLAAQYGVDPKETLTNYREMYRIANPELQAKEVKNAKGTMARYEWYNPRKPDKPLYAGEWFSTPQATSAELKVNVNALPHEASNSMADAFVNGKMAPSQMSKRGQLQQNVFPAVWAKYPNFNMMLAEANYKYMTNPQNLRAISLVDAVQPRLAAMVSQFDKMKPGNIQGVNYVMNEINRQFGRPEVTGFESNRNAIVQEVNTALSGTSTQSDLRIKLELENLRTANSPAQMRSALNNLNEALISRKDASQAVPYPWEVVRGEKSQEQWQREQNEAARKSFRSETQQTPTKPGTTFKIGGYTVTVK